MRDLPRSIRMGGITLLTVFLVLCLTVFGVLSLVSARADARLCEKNTAQVKAYYAADSKAEEELRSLSLTLRSAQAESVQAGDETEFWRLIATAEGERFDAKERTLSYAVPVTEEQELRVKLRVIAPTTGRDADYEILVWRTVVTVDYEIDNSLNVWDGT